MKGVDTMVLGASHSIMVSNTPNRVQEDITPLSQGIFSSKEVDFKQFGLFGGSIDYNTFYPDADKESFTPNSEDYIEPMYRLLSSCIVNKAYAPVEFPEDILKASMYLLVGQTVNCDHETSVGNAIGAVKSVSWQEAYKDEATEVEVPAGINGVLKIDGKSNPRIVRGILMDPPSIHSNSVTVMFEWEPSHTFDKPWMFYEKWGTYDENGELVRKIVTKIISYKETSLVSHGADPFAQIIRDGKIINPTYAGSSYYSFSEGVKDVPKDPRQYVSYFDFKSFQDVNLYGTHSITTNGLKHDTTKNNNKSNKPLNMNEEVNQFLETFGETGAFSEGEVITRDLVLARFKEVLEKRASLERELGELKEKMGKAEEELREAKEMASLGEAHLSEIREETLANYRKVNGEKVDDNIVSLIESKDTGAKTLAALNAGYKAQLEEKFPLSCRDCGSHNVDRGTGKPAQENEEEFEEGQKSIQDMVKSLAAKKLRGE